MQHCACKCNSSYVNIEKIKYDKSLTICTNQPFGVNYNGKSHLNTNKYQKVSPNRNNLRFYKSFKQIARS